MRTNNQITTENQSTFIQSYEVKKSRTGLSIPVINSVHLHSMYDPEKEAQKLMDHYAREISTGKNFLVLGCGFGYHLNELFYRLEKREIHDYKIVVVDPLERVVEDAYALQTLKFPFATMKIGLSIDQLFSDKKFITFLSDRPVIITHNPSFNLCSNYFSQMHNYKASTVISDFTPLLDSKEVSDYLINLQTHKVWHKVCEDIAKTKLLETDLDYLFAAYHLISKQEGAQL